MSTTVNMGCELDPSIIKEVFKEPLGPVVGFISQFVIMPVSSYFAGWLVSGDKLFRLGLFIMGCCPGKYKTYSPYSILSNAETFYQSLAR